MKKLSLKDLKLDAKELLQKDQLRAVFGGYAGNCSGLSTCGVQGASCGSGGTCIPVLCPYYEGGPNMGVLVCIE